MERVEAEEMSAGGIYIPDTSKQKPQEAIIRALGTGGRDKDGNVIEFSVEVGNKILMSRYGGTEIERDGTTYTIINESDILAIID